MVLFRLVDFMLGFFVGDGKLCRLGGLIRSMFFLMALRERDLVAICGSELRVTGISV